jgi:hypothetical protein
MLRFQVQNGCPIANEEGIPIPGRSRWSNDKDNANFISANSNTKRAVKTYQQWQMDCHNDSTPIELLDRNILIERLEVFFQQV